MKTTTLTYLQPPVPHSTAVLRGLHGALKRQGGPGDGAEFSHRGRALCPRGTARQLRLGWEWGEHAGVEALVPTGWKSGPPVRSLDQHSSRANGANSQPCPRPTEPETPGRAQRSCLSSAPGDSDTRKPPGGEEASPLSEVPRRAATPGDKGVEPPPVWGGPPSQTLKGRAKTRTPGFGFLLRTHELPAL